MVAASLKYEPSQSNKTLYVVARDNGFGDGCTLYLIGQPNMMIEFDYSPRGPLSKIFKNGLSRMAQTLTSFEKDGYQISYDIPPRMARSNCRDTPFRTLSLEEMLGIRRAQNLPELKLAA